MNTYHHLKNNNPHPTNNKNNTHPTNCNPHLTNNKNNTQTNYNYNNKLTK